MAFRNNGFITIFIFIQFLGRAGASIQIQASPPDINAIEVKPLTITCTYTPLANTSTSAIDYLVITKRDPNLLSNDALSELTKSNPNTPTISQKWDITSVSGSLSQDGHGPSHLSVTWNTPTATEAGVYICAAKTFDGAGIPNSLTKEVTVREDSTLVIAQKLRSLQKDLAAQQECCRLATAHLVEFEVWRKTITTGLKYFADNLVFNRSTEFKNRTYAVSLFNVEGADIAKAVCQTMGGYLAEINDAGEWTFIKQFLNLPGPDTKCLLIGGRDDVQEGRWYWEKGETTMTFAPWGPGEPNNSGNEDCVEILASPASVNINDISCRYKNRYGFICEIPTDGHS